MRILLLVIFLTFTGISYASPEVNNLKIEQTSSWNYTTGYHSDGTSTSIRYSTDYNGNIQSIQIAYQGSWHSTSVSWDGNRMYAKNPYNKRYYF